MDKYSTYMDGDGLRLNKPITPEMEEELRKELAGTGLSVKLIVDENRNIIFFSDGEEFDYSQVLFKGLKALKDFLKDKGYGFVDGELEYWGDDRSDFGRVYVWNGDLVVAQGFIDYCINEVL